MFDSRKGEETQPANAGEEEEAGGFIGEMGRVWTTEEEEMGKAVRGMKDPFLGKRGRGGERKGLPSDGGEMSGRKQMTQGKRGSG